MYLETKMAFIKKVLAKTDIHWLWAMPIVPIVTNTKSYISDVFVSKVKSWVCGARKQHRRIKAQFTDVSVQLLETNIQNWGLQRLLNICIACFPQRSVELYISLLWRHTADVVLLHIWHLWGEVSRLIWQADISLWLWKKSINGEVIMILYEQCIIYKKNHFDSYPFFCTQRQLFWIRLKSCNSDSVLVPLFVFVAALKSLVFSIVWFVKLWDMTSNQT